LTSILVLITLLIVAGVAPVSAAILYDNGPINGNTYAWTINFGLIVSDSFALSSPGTVSGANFGAWAYPGDLMTQVDWAITSDPGVGPVTVYGFGTASTTQTYLSGNGNGYDLDWESISFSGLTLGTGTYWFELQNAVVSNGDPTYWDQNDGPSAAWENSLGYLATGGPSNGDPCTGACTYSETFQLTGTPSAVPEPASLGLIGMGLLGMAALLRRRISK
jgi:hypothetical protein